MWIYAESPSSRSIRICIYIYESHGELVLLGMVSIGFLHDFSRCPLAPLGDLSSKDLSAIRFCKTGGLSLTDEVMGVAGES